MPLGGTIFVAGVGAVLIEEKLAAMMIYETKGLLVNCMGNAYRAAVPKAAKS